MSQSQSFEQELKNYFVDHQIPFKDNSRSFHKLDFGFGDIKAKTHFSFDAKEKRQHYAMHNWKITAIPEEHLFILDDLAARKILAYAPNSGLVVRDNLRHRYFFFSVLDLYLMPKQRANRKIQKNVSEIKGKWLIDFRNGQMADNLAVIFSGIAAYLSQREDIFTRRLECYGNYSGEQISDGGIERHPPFWIKDLNETR